MDAQLETSGATIATPTGLDPAAVLELSAAERSLLAEWHATKAGQDGGRPWWPWAVRRLSLETRMKLAADQAVDAAWEEHERASVVASPVYLTRYYGHLQPPKGPPIPFVMWREQEEVLVAFWHRRKVIVLKARQLGLTWLALHYATWVQGYNPETPNAKILALSKRAEDASKLIRRMRRIQELLPPYLQIAEDPETRGSLSRYKLLERGETQSLPATEDAARSETATLGLCDEFAFPRNGQAGPTLTALEPTLGEEGQEIILSTGNGETGDGAAMAEEFRKALKGESERFPIFLPANVDPRRTPAWRAAKRGNYENEESFKAEHPETVDEALGGQGAVKIYPSEDLAAALAIGRAIAAHDHGTWLQKLVLTEGLEWGIDWGDFQTFAVYVVGLPGGGMFVVDELVQSQTEPGAASRAITGYELAGTEGVRFVRSSADSSPAGTNRTFAGVLEQRRREQPGRFPETHVSVPFGIFKEGGGSNPGGVNTVAYLQRLAAASSAFIDRPEWEANIHEANGLLAIHDRCRFLKAQMQKLERDPETGKVRKPALDPRNPEKGDHGPDALVAAGHKRAESWTATLGGEEND